MTHIASDRRRGGHMIFTLCGKNIDKGVLGRKSNGRPPVVGYDGLQDAVPVHTFQYLCQKCLDAPGGMDKIHGIMLKQLPNMQEIHVSSHLNDEAVVMVCGKSWDRQSVFRNNIGFIPPELYIKTQRKLRYKICDECADNPRVQLQILHEVEL